MSLTVYQNKTSGAMWKLWSNFSEILTVNQYKHPPSVDQCLFANRKKAVRKGSTDILPSITKSHGQQVSTSNSWFHDPLRTMLLFNH